MIAGASCSPPLPLPPLLPNILCLCQCVQSETFENQNLPAMTAWDSFPAEKMDVGFWGWADRGQGSKAETNCSIWDEKEEARQHKECGDNGAERESCSSAACRGSGVTERAVHKLAVCSASPPIREHAPLGTHMARQANPKRGPKEDELNCSTFFSQTRGSVISRLLAEQSGG